MQVPVKPIYLIHGEDAWQANKIIDSVNQYYIKLNNNIKKYNFFSFAEFEEANKNQTLLANLDLFASQKIIKIYINNGVLTKEQQDKLINIINNLPDNVIIIIVADKLNKSYFSLPWVKVLGKKGLIIAAGSNIAKANYSVFAFSKALESNNLEHVIYIFHKLKEANSPLLLVLWAIIKAIKNLLVKNPDNKNLYLCLQQAGCADLAIKNISEEKQDLWVLLLDLVIKIRESPLNDGK